MNETNNNTIRSFKDFRRSISALNFSCDESPDLYFNETQTDKRTSSIKAIMITESTYLKRICELLTDIFEHFDKNFNKIGKKHILTQIQGLFDKFPVINQLHVTLQHKMKESLQSTKEIGNDLLEFLCQPELLAIYSSYVENFSSIMEICQNIKEKGYLKGQSQLMNIESILTSPIQRFPQLSMAIGDIYKYTPDEHKDKISLFKAVAISKSITARLDRQRREFEYSNFSEMESNLQRLKLPFISKQLLANNSVFDVRSDYQIPRRIVKVPYYLILCDNNVVLLPKDVSLSELTDRITFCYSLNEVECKQKVLSHFTDQNNSYFDLEEARSLYSLVNDSFSNDVTVKEYESLLNDYRILIKLNDDLHSLNFRYRGIDTLKLSKSLIELEHQLKSKEIELNLQLGSILTLTINTNNAQELKKIFVFDSIRQSNEWKMNFNRAKLLLGIDMTMCWKYFSFHSKLSQIKAKELPVLFDPFVLKNNGIIDVPSGIVKSQSVALVVGWKIYRCLWICLTNGWVVILHFDYKQWMVLESFKMENSAAVSAICVSGSSNIDSPENPYDSEIWISCGDSIYIHSLLENQRSIVRKRLHLPSDVKSMYNVNNRMLVALQSKRVFVYSKRQGPFWLQECDFSFNRYLTPFSEEVRELFYGHQLIYVLLKSKIIICKELGVNFSPIKVHEMKQEIATLFVTDDGVWVTVNSSRQLILFDKMFINEMQTISIPLIFYKSCEVGNVTCIYISDRYTWLGTENGFIICIAAIDRRYCVDDKIPMYFSSMSSVGPITQLIPFQNIHGVNVRYSPEEYVSKKEIFDQRVPPIRRSISNPPLEEGYQRLSFSCQNINKLYNGCKEESETSSNSSLQSAIEHLKNTTPTLIIGFGSGIAKYKDNPDENESTCTCDYDDQTTLFTLFE